MKEGHFKAEDLLKEIRRELVGLGSSTFGRGVWETIWAVALAAEDPERIELITKRLYPDIAKRFKSNAVAVERNIRRVIHQLWKKNPDRIGAFMETDPAVRPTSKAFLLRLYEVVSSRHQGGTIPAADTTS